MLLSYHFGKIVTWYDVSGAYKQKLTRFLDGGTHIVIYNRDMMWISSIYIDANRRTHEHVEYIDDRGEAVVGSPSIVIDVYGNEREILELV